ncbi:MAG: folate family ECF transporter S component [Clostridia bacterium]|nr:folate family ECF transporter S component [Clostridia bacterium]
MQKTVPSTLYRSPFHLNYWRDAKACMKDLRLLVLAALLVAGRVAITSFYIMVGENLKISFGFFLNALGSLIYGPFIGLLTGFATDILGFLLHPMGGAFFPGYTLTAMLGSFVYALFFFRARITVRRIVLCKLTVNLLVNVGLNCLWSAMLYSKGYFYYLAKSLTKNLLMLPIEILILLVFFRVMLPVVSGMGLTPPQPDNKIPF